MGRNIGFHTRLVSNNAIKVSGGSFGGGVDEETVNRLVKAHFTVTVKDSGRAVFVDRQGREVLLYLSIDASETEIGKQVLTEWRKLKAEEAEKNEAIEQQQSEVISELMGGLTFDEIVRRLKG